MDFSFTNYLITGVLTLIAVAPLVRWQITFLLKKTEALEKKSDILEDKILKSQTDFTEKLFAVLSSHSEMQNKSLIIVTESHSKALEKMTDKFTDAFREVAEINVQSEKYLDKKLSGVYRELKINKDSVTDEIKGVKEGQATLVSEFKDDIHNLEIKMVEKGAINA